MQYRHRDPWHNDHWSYPIRRDGEWILRPTPGAIAGIKLIQQIVNARKRDPRVTLVSWISGHNQSVGYGTHFLVSGPGAAESARIAERLARRFRMRLCPSLHSDDMLGAKRHPGTAASWNFVTGAEIIAADPSISIGGNPYDWAKLFFPNMVAQSSEVPMLAPARLSPPTLRPGRGHQPWEGCMALGDARSIAWDLTRYMGNNLAPLIELAKLLPRDDPYVSATLALANQNHWGATVHDNRPDDTVLRPGEAFQIVCVGPLSRSRTLGPPAWMVWRYLDEARRLMPSRDPLLLAREHLEDISRPIIRWNAELEQQNQRRAFVVQILAGEVSAFGAVGIRPRQMRRRLPKGVVE
jgi:hypothetical protein